MNFPPEYTLRVSVRARRVSLRVLPGRGLEVVLPSHVDPACVPDIVQRNRAWIEKALTRMGGSPLPESSGGVPKGFFLRGGLEYVRVQPHRSLPAAGPAAGENGESGKPGGKSVPARCLVLPATLHPDLAPHSVLAWLREWVREEARRCCFPLLKELADAHGFSFADAHVRFQRGRWGSCSARGALNLNGCLLFLPDVLMRHILLHELCHTREMNHSERFWKLLFAVEPNALELDRTLRTAWRYVPGWIFGVHRGAPRPLKPPQAAPGKAR